MSMTKRYLESLPQEKQDAILGRPSEGEEEAECAGCEWTFPASALSSKGLCEDCERGEGLGGAAGEFNAHFNPNDCGGVLDGYGVISDADPGLQRTHHGN